jgi:hypothetical protein
VLSLSLFLFDALVQALADNESKCTTRTTGNCKLRSSVSVQVERGADEPFI